MSTSNNNNKQRIIRKFKRGSGEAKINVIRIKDSVRSDLQFIKGVIGINPGSSEGDVIENLIKMFKQKKIGQLSLGKDIRIPLESEDMVTFFKDKETEKTIKDYEYLLNEKQSTLDNYVQYLDTACELAKVDKVRVIEIVQNNRKNMINKLLDWIS
jgi:hypothetical protein